MPPLQITKPKDTSRALIGPHVGQSMCNRNTKVAGSLYKDDDLHPCHRFV